MVHMLQFWKYKHLVIKPVKIQLFSKDLFDLKLCNTWTFPIWFPLLFSWAYPNSY